MQVSVGFSGPAGSGVMTAWLFLWKILAQKWYFVVGDKEYESIIKWWNNIFILYISDDKNYLSKKIDYLFYYNNYGLTKYENLYEIQNSYEVKKSDCNHQNTLSLAMACKILGIDILELENLFRDKFWNKEEILKQNLDDIQKWFSNIENSIFQVKNLWNEKEFLYWNEIIWEWAMASGLEFYSAYPMTPASSIIEVVTQTPQFSRSPKPVFFQWEDEIAVSMSMLGAHFAGKRSMCWTSWWGFALMTESISFANQAELWWVYILSQRAGPSTWTPTYTEQWDINYALNASFGDTFPIVLAPSNFEDGFNLIWKALNRSDQYQHPVIFLSDKQYSENYMSIEKSKLKAEIINRWKRVETEMSQDEKFARYEITEDWVSPYSIPWVKWWEFIATSYEHDIYWATSEDPLARKIMTQKRMKKIEKTFVKEVFNQDFYGYEIIKPDSKNFFVTFGINRLVLEDFIKTNSDWWIIIVKVFQPVDPRLTQFFEENVDKISGLKFVELNYSGQFEQHIRTQCNLRTQERNDKIEHIRKYENYPFFLEDFVNN